jgi:RHS repeat-associated protein
VSATDYYPGGMELPGRKFNNSTYRYGFQNQEVDRELWGGAISFEYRVADPRLVRFFSEDPLSDDYPWNSPYAFAENRLIDGIELEGLEWKPTKDKEGTVTGYTWSGYNKDGSAVEGTVSGGIVYNKEKGYNTWYTSDKATRSGTVDFMSAGSKEPYQKYCEVALSGVTNKVNVTINYKDNWVTPTGFYGNSQKSYKQVTISAEFWNESGRANSDPITIDQFGRTGKLWETVSLKSYSDPKNLFNSYRHSMGYADGPTSGALIPVYPETLLMPLPKGLNLLGKASGGMKQWFRLGESYSKAGKFQTYGLRWGASPKYANKIGNATLRQLNQDFRKTKIPFKSWRTADPGHFHFWKLK